MKLKNIKNLIEKNIIAFATSDKDIPNVIPVACCKVIENKILITDNFMRTTSKNLIKNKNVCLAVWNKNKGYKLIGKANYFNSGKWKKFVGNMKENKGLPAKGAILIGIRKIIKLC